MLAFQSPSMFYLADITVLSQRRQFAAGGARSFADARSFVVMEWGPYNAGPRAAIAFKVVTSKTFDAAIQSSIREWRVLS
jgi:hypothetical protein